MSLVLLLQLLDVLLPLGRGLLLELLDLILQLLYLRNQAGFKLLLHLGVLLDLLGQLEELLLELLAGICVVPYQLLVLGNVFLQIVENLQFFVECDQRVQLVLELNLLFLES